MTSFLLFSVPLLLAVCSFFYHVAVCLAALWFRREREKASDFTPPVSILKAVRGIDQSLYACLESHFRQDYPSLEIVFGLSDPKDPARWTIAQLQRDFPRIPVKVVTVPEPAGVNPKMSKVARMVEEAAHEIVVITDADIRMEPGDLRQMVGPLSDDRVGLVTCLYRGVPARQLLSILEALGMSAEFAGQVLLARATRGVRFGLGAALATRKKQITEIGGLTRCADYLADDYILGNRIAAAGYRVHLSQTVVETALPFRSLSELWDQQMRWARTIRSCNPRGYPGLLLAYGVPLGALAAAYRPDSALALAGLAAVLLARLLSAWASGVLVCRDPAVKKFFWLIPLRDLFSLAVWGASFFGRRVVWRGARFRLEPGGRIRPA